MMENAVKLIEDAEHLIETNEYNTVTIKGVRNISRSDLDTLKLYAESHIASGGYGFNGLMEPTGNIKLVLEKYNIKTVGYY